MTIRLVSNITHSSLDSTACLNVKLGVGVKTELPVLISPQQIKSSELTNFNGLKPTSAPTKQAQKHDRIHYNRKHT